MPRDLMAADAVAIPFTYTHQHPSRTMVYRSMASMVAPPTRSPRRIINAGNNTANMRSVLGPSQRELRSRLSAASSHGNDAHIELGETHQNYPYTQQNGYHLRAVSANGHRQQNRQGNKTPVRHYELRDDSTMAHSTSKGRRPSSEASSRGSSSRGRRRPSSSTKKKKRKPPSGYMDNILQQENDDLRRKLNEMEARFKRLEDGLSERRDKHHLDDLTTPRHPTHIPHTPPPPPLVASTPRRSPPPSTRLTSSTIINTVTSGAADDDYMGYERRTAPLRTWYDSPDRTTRHQPHATSPSVVTTTPPTSSGGGADGTSSLRRDAKHSCDTSFNYSCAHPHHHPAYEPTSFTAVVDDVASQKKKFSTQVHKPLPPGTFKNYEDFRKGYQQLEMERAREQRNLEYRLKEARSSPPTRTTSHIPSTNYHPGRKQQSVVSIIKSTNSTHRNRGYARSVSAPHQAATPKRSGKKTPSRKKVDTNNTSSHLSTTTRPRRRRAASSMAASSLHTPSISAIGATSRLTNPHSTDVSTTTTHFIHEDCVVAIPCAGTRSGSARQRMQLYTQLSPERGVASENRYPVWTASTTTSRGETSAAMRGGGQQRYSDPYHGGAATSTQPPRRGSSSTDIQFQGDTPSSPPRTRDQYWQQSRAVLSELERAFSMGF